MTGSPSPAPAVEPVIAARVAERAAQWFPEHAGAVNVHVRAMSHRPKCSLYAVHLDGVGSAPEIVAKVRRDPPASGSSSPRASRPRLRSESASAAELTALEYDGLLAIQAAIGTRYDCFGAVPALDHLPAQATILMGFVDCGTVRGQLIGESRLGRLRIRAGGRSSSSSAVWRNVGGWLRVYQQSVQLSGRPARQGTRDEIVDHFAAHHDFLTSRLGSGRAGDIALRGAELASEILPAQLDLSVGHGDYAPRNIFADRDGRVTVFDPMPRWRVPAFEDICRFLVGIRLLGLQLHTHGGAFSRAQLDRYESDALRGFLDGPGPSPQIRCYQLFILLDKWSALVEAAGSGGGPRRRLNKASLLLANSYLRSEAERLLGLARSSSA